MIGQIKTQKYFGRTTQHNDKLQLVIKLTVWPNGLQNSTVKRGYSMGYKYFVQVRLYFKDSFEYSKMLVCYEITGTNI